ncbi:hypothetical protein CCUS01_16950 [Colletotrichum cuscutae]|uniref:Uncharacterized protein n=1 Tax=Colletotrichum cuscutae TaxID=1209917 RepID=A0AAI9VB80_9PEZI|nr:hypothetical protein CCUS01_16950 [Colletotrichum cuscutae]
MPPRKNISSSARRIARPSHIAHPRPLPHNLVVENRLRAARARELEARREAQAAARAARAASRQAPREAQLALEELRRREAREERLLQEEEDSAHTHSNQSNK